MSRMHPRETRVLKAKSELRLSITEVQEKHDLTDAETLRVVNEAMSGWIAVFTKYEIREERHGRTDLAGGLAYTEEQEEKQSDK